MRNRLLIPLALAAAIGAVAVAGCGDDDDDTADGSGETLTEEEFVTQANQICADGDKEIAQAGQEVPDNASQQDINAFVVDVVVPSIQEQLDGIRALAAPEEIADDVDTLLTDAEAALGEVEDDPTLVLADDDGPFADVNRQADALGLTKCAG